MLLGVEEILTATSEADRLMIFLRVTVTSSFSLAWHRTPHYPQSQLIKPGLAWDSTIAKNKPFIKNTRKTEIGRNLHS